MATEDMADILADWGVDGTLNGQPVRVVHNGPSRLAGLGGPGMTCTDDVAWLPTDTVPEDCVGAVLLIPAGSFKVREHNPDGEGGSVLVL